MTELWIDYWVGTALLSAMAFSMGFVTGNHNKVSSSLYENAFDRVEYFSKECARLRNELNSCWKYINTHTQLKRKKEEAKKPRDSKGRYAKKCK